MSFKKKTILIGLLMIILIASFQTINKSNATTAIGNNVDWSKNQDEILNSVTSGAPVYVLNNNIIESITNNTYFSGGDKIHNTYKLHMNDAPSGEAIYKNDWLYCIEHGTNTYNGDYIIEKINIIKNASATTIRYARPGAVYSNSNGLLDDDEGVKYFARGGKDSFSDNNYYANWGTYESVKYKDGLFYYNNYYKLTSSNKKNAQRAYILSADENKNYTNYLNYKDSNAKQRALWKVEEQLSTSERLEGDALTLYEKSAKFASYKTAINPASIAKGDGFDQNFTNGSVFKNGFVLIGPLTAKFNSEFGKINGIKVKYGTDKYLQIGDFYISDRAGSKNGFLDDIPNGTAFYIKIPNFVISSKGVTKIEEIIATFNDVNAYAFYSFLIQEGTTDIQNQLIINNAKRENNTITKSITVNQNLIPPVEIKLNKKSTLKNDMGQNYDLSGATFAISYGDRVKNMSLVSGATSQYYYRWQPTNTNEINITIKETATPSQHQTLSGDIKIKLKLQNGQWVPTIENNPDNFVTITHGTRN